MIIGAVKMADKVTYFIPMFGRFRSIMVNGTTAQYYGVNPLRSANSIKCAICSHAAIVRTA